MATRRRQARNLRKHLETLALLWGHAERFGVRIIATTKKRSKWWPPFFYEREGHPAQPISIADTEALIVKDLRKPPPERRTGDRS